MLNIKAWVVALLGAVMVMQSGFAAEPAKVEPAKAGVAKKAVEGEAEVRKALESILSSPDAVESIRKAGYGGFYEVVLANGDIAYVDPTGTFLISGALIDLKSKKNVTSERMDELARIDFSALPLTSAIKQVRGNGKRILVTFEDPNCGFCKKLAHELTTLKDATIYTFMIPILAADSADKSKAIWCAPDRAKAWNDWMVDGKLPAGNASCDNPIAKNLELSRKLRVAGTPTMFVADGNRLGGGYLPLDELDKRLTAATERLQAKK